MNRREFITLLGGAAVWPLAARAQQGDRVRRIGMLMGFDGNDPDIKPRVPAFTQALADLGCTDGRNSAFCGESFAEPPGKIEEISIIGTVNLPDDSEYCAGFGECWRSLFESAKDVVDSYLGEKGPPVGRPSESEPQ
jgi:hypothetical protein